MKKSDWIKKGRDGAKASDQDFGAGDWRWAAIEYGRALAIVEDGKEALLEKWESVELVKGNLPVLKKNADFFDGKEDASEKLDRATALAIQADSCREAREALSLSINEIADALGVHRQTWVKWERGEQKAPAVAFTAMDMLIYMAQNGLEWPLEE